jgi:type II secretion system protein G
MIGRAESDIAVIDTMLELYNLDNGVYPTTEQGLKALFEKPTIPPIPANWTKKYIMKKPIDPWKNEYKYCYPGIHNKDKYDIWSIGPDGIDGTDDDICNWKETKIPAESVYTFSIQQILIIGGSCVIVIIALSIWRSVRRKIRNPNQD